MSGASQDLKEGMISKMHMHKKFMMACMAIAAFAAFVVAPAASASPVATDPVGTPLPAGTSIKATSAGITKFTLTKGGGSVECTHAELKGTLTKNSGTKIAGEIPASMFGVNYTFSGTGTNGDCTSPLGAVKPTLISALCLETTTATGAGPHDLLVTGCAGKPITFILDATVGPQCKYSTSSVSGIYVTGDATVEVKEQQATLEEANVFCPHEGWLDMHFDLTTTNGGTILVS